MQHPSFDFGGSTYSRDLDGNRLNRQLDAVKLCLIANEYQWLTPRQFEQMLQPYSWCSISARLRDLRKKQHGSWTIQRRRSDAHPGVWEYRYVPIRSAYEEQQ